MSHVQYPMLAAGGGGGRGLQLAINKIQVYLNTEPMVTMKYNYSCNLQN